MDRDEQEDEMTEHERQTDNHHKKVTILAERHVDFLLKIMRPLMIAEFVHGYKHGFEEGKNEKEAP